MAKRKIYDISQSSQSLPNTNDTPVIRRGGGTVFLEFLTKLFYGIFYLTVIILASAGATTLLNGQLRDMLFELIQNTFFTQ